MIKAEVKLGSGCDLVWNQYGDPEYQQWNDVSLDYTEHSPDGYYSDHQTSVDIDREKALEIVGFLTKAFNL